MKSIRLAFSFFMFVLTTGLSAQTLLAYNATINNKKETKEITKENSVVSFKEDKKYKWEFLSAIPHNFGNNTIENSGKHDFGQKIACLKVLIDKYYITKEDVIPGDPMMRTIVLKPNVYYVTRKIEKHLKKEVKDGDISLEEASKEFAHILEVALAIIDSEESNTFEMALSKSKKNIEDQITIFSQVKLQNIY